MNHEAVFLVILGTSSFPSGHEVFSFFPYNSYLAGNELVPSMTINKAYGTVVESYMFPLNMLIDETLDNHFQTLPARHFRLRLAMGGNEVRVEFEPIREGHTWIALWT